MFLSNPGHTHQALTNLCALAPMAKTPSSFADTLSTSSRSGTSSHTSATSEPGAGDYEHKVDFDIIEDDDDEECGSLTFIKSLGPRFRGVEDLVTHPKPGTDDVNMVDLEAPASVISHFDYEAEHADYKHTRGILREMGGECEELAILPYNHAYFRTEMPDGSKVIMAKFHDAYAKRHTGYPAFEGDKVSDELQQEFEDRACDVSKHKPHFLLFKHMSKIIVDDEGPRLNIGCFEYPRETAMVWNEDFDEIPLPLEEDRVIVGLVRSGGRRTTIYEKMRVRKDMPGDPMAFSSCRKGIEAARAFVEYQNDDEQIECGAPIPDSDRPCFDGKLPLKELPEGLHEHLHDLPGQNDSFIHRILDRLENLRAEPEEYDRQVATASNEHATGSGITRNRNGLEEDIIIGVWDELNHDEEYNAAALRGLGLLNPEDDFGDNPEYVKAKKLWWEQKLGIRGMEAIVRYHMQRIRALRRPNRAEYFLSEYEEAYGLNYDSPEYPASRGEIEEVSEDCQVYDALHASPVDWTAKCGSRIRLWRLSVTDVIPHNDFGDGEECRRAYDALVEYQDSWEPGCEAHEDLEDFARPLLAGRRVPTMAALERLGVELPPSTEGEVNELLAGAAAPHLVESDQIYGQLAPVQRLSPCVSWSDRPLRRHDSIVELEENKTFLAGPEIRYVPGIIAAILGASNDTVLRTPMSLPPDDNLVAYTEESQEKEVVKQLDRQDADNTNTTHRANLTSASQTTDSSAPVSVSEARPFPVGLTAHIRATQNDEVLDPTDAIATGHTAIARSAVCRPTWENKTAASAPSPKFLKAFREKKASMNSIKSSIQVPQGIIAAYPIVEIGVDGEEVGMSSQFEQHNIPGHISVGERVREGLLTPETSRLHHHNTSDTMQSGVLTRRSSQRTDLPAYSPLSAQQHISVDECLTEKYIHGNTLQDEQEQAIRDLIALLRPRNDAENRLMGVLHSNGRRK